MGQEFASSSAGWFWLKISHEVSVKMLAGAGTVGRFDWDWGVCSFMSLARGYWLLAGDFRSGHEDVSVVLLECHQGTATLTPMGPREDEAEATMVL